MTVRATVFIAFRRQLATVWAKGIVLLKDFLKLFVIVFMAIALGFGTMPKAYAQQAPALLKQATDGSRPVAMPPNELARLNDPMFNLVLKEHSDVTTLEGITQRLQANSKNVFVVGEQIVDPKPVSSRRSVITFDGETAGEQLRNNVMLSVFFDSKSFPSFRQIEAIAWDETGGKFNYYKLDGPNNDLTWRFRGDSQGADLLSSNERAGTCMACHINGGMVMKEFNPPWNNWHSLDFDASYLRSGSNNAWSIAKATNSPLKDLRGASGLESTVQSADRRFNARRIAALNSGARVTDVKRLLKPLFVTTEVNLMSSFANSSSHPFGDGRASGTVDLPLSFFLNSSVLRELGVNSFELSNVTSPLEDREYQAVVRQGQTRLNGKTPGDTHFAWFTPEASDIDNTYVSQLIEENIVPKEFVAAVMAVDLENPVLSDDRAGLWQAQNILPTRFNTGRNNDLMAQTIRNLEQLNPASSSPEGQFLSALKSPDPVALLQDSVNRYIERERKLVEADKPFEVARLYGKLLKIREKVKKDEVQGHLHSEFSLLFPTGNIAALPDAPKQPGNSAPSQRPTLAKGDRGDNVETLQRLLTTLGFLNGPIDGDFGVGTERAVITAQRTMKLDADGIVGPKSWSTFERVSALPALTVGSDGTDVKTLQSLLNATGFLNRPIDTDGIFGPGTKQAVIDTQRRLGLTANGKVSPATWARLGA